MKFKLAICLAAVGILALLAWCPWITPDFAAARAVNVFEERQKGIVDGCGFNCKGCGVKEAARAWFGSVVTIEYACGLLPADLPQYHRTGRAFVSCLGTVHFT